MSSVSVSVFSRQAQTLDLSPAEAAVWEAASNTVQGASVVWLTNEVAAAAAATLTSRLADTVANASGPAAAVLSTNAARPLTMVRLRTGPAGARAGQRPQPNGYPLLRDPPPPTCVWPGSGLVSWWKGEGDAWDMQGRNPGVLVGDPAFEAGEVGYAFALNGSSQRMEVPYDSSLATPSFSIECWVCLSSQVGGQAFVYGQSYARQLVVQKLGGSMYVTLYVTSPGGTFYGVRSTHAIAVGTWVHLAGTWDGLHLRVYLDGALDAQGTMNLPIIGDSGCSFSIGSVGTCGASQYFPGRIHEVSVYDRALFPGEINSIYQAGSLGKCVALPSCVSYPSSIGSWWAAEGNASDSAGASPGALQNGATFSSGMVGQAFSFDGENQGVTIPYASALAGENFSVEAWVKPARPAAWQAFVFGQNYGRQLVVQPGARGLKVLWVISDDPWTFYWAQSSGDIPFDQWTHLAGTWDGVALRLYINGALDDEEALETIAWDSGCTFHIGGVYEPEGGCAYVDQFFNGLIDEVTYYNQALSDAEVQGLYNAGSVGKCAVPPTIISQPQSQTVTVGNDAILRVSATGSSLNYQWYKGENGLWSETPSMLYLANVGMESAGAYTVKVWNDAGWVISEEAVLTVMPAIPFATPDGAVAWWRADGDDPWNGTIAEDCVGDNDAEREELMDYVNPGKVGWAFKFGAYGADLLVPAREGLNSSTWDGFTIEGWVYPCCLEDAQPLFEQWDAVSGCRMTLSFSASSPGSLEMTWVDSSGTHQLGSPPGTVRQNTFQHFALACQDQQGSTFVKLYLNGQMVAASEDQLALDLGATDFYFGCSPYMLSLEEPARTMQPRLLNGCLDELTVYNRALSGTEIQGIYHASSAGKAPPCTAAPADCVSWWQGEGDGADVHARNLAVPEGGVTFTAGHKGRAFTFDGAAAVRVPASASLNVGAGEGFTVEGWVNPSSLSAAQPLFEWNAASFTGVAVWVSDTGYLCADIPDEALIDNFFYGNQLTAGTFQHVALTYDSSDTTGRLYLNGRQVGSMGCFFLLPILTRGDFWIGFSPNDDLGTGTQFAGQIDEAGLYNRALSASEIRRLCTAGSGGKCGLAPNIVTQPESQTAHVGNNVAFQVVAAGTALTYQWSRNSVAISGATTPILTLLNLQTSQAGTYSVTVANDVASVPSSGAMLVVNPAGNGTPPTITTQPQSLTTACEGGPVELSVAATGNGALTYQWCKNSININGATASNYALSQVSSPDQGTYTVIVYDSVGHLTSADAVLAVHPRPTAAITGGGTIHPGGSETADIQILLTGTGPWTLRWSDGQVETVPAIDNPHLRQVAPPTTTIYSLTALSDTYCSARTTELGHPVEVKVEGPNLDWPIRAGFTHLQAGTYNNHTFGSDMMFYLDGEVTLTGTTTFEGGTVVYFAPLSESTARIIITGPVVCDTAPYRPATFTSSDRINYIWYFDDPSAPMTDYYGQGLSLQTTSPTVLKHFRFFNLGCGLSLDSATACSLYNCQFADCDTAIAQTDAGASLNLYNALFCDDNAVIALDAAAQAPQINFQHITVDNCDNFASGLPATPAGAWTGKNSLLVNVHNAASIPSNLQRDVNNCPTIASSSGVFATAGDGSHYLADDTYRGQGTLTGLDATLVSELPQKTSRPPMTLPLDFETAGSITLSPQLPRYSSGAPDLGYQYEVLDYTLSDFVVDPGGQVTVLPGTAIGIRYDWVPGFQLLHGASFVSEGTPTRPNTFVAVSAVQEGPFPHLFWYPGFQISFIPCYWPEVVADPWTCPDYNAAGDPPPTLRFRFSNLYLSAGFSYHLWGGMAMPSFYGLLGCASYDSAMFLSMRDCALHGGWLHLGEPHGGVIPPVEQDGGPFAWIYGPPIPGSVTWFNNLFDRVNVSLDPDTGPAYWGGPYELPTIDLYVTATNNLFHGGWLFLEPTDASAGNWVFQNNLFDKTVFAQDADQPLNQDYNGYWPCAPGELLIGQMDKLKPDATHDVLLDAAPPYVSSYLGGYYLPNALPGTPQLFGAGICPPADVGLYHYTTCAAQTKEGEIIPPHNANIGLHYIAVETSGPHSGQPKDYDTDLIPDYVEDANGNGVQDTGETDWMTDYSGPDDPPVEDPYSSVYDEVDLDGDGLPGAAEQVLGTDCLVGDNLLAGATLALPGTVSGLVTVPLSIPPSVEDRVFMAFTANGQATAARIHKVDGDWFAEWDTTLLANGVYYVAIEVQVAGQSAVAVCPGRRLTVQNAICFPDASLTVGDELNINAQTIHANGTWTMEIYDDQDNLFDFLEGDVDENGFCNYPDASYQGVSISLLDGEGNPLPSEYYTVVLTTSAPESMGWATTTTRRYYERPWSNYRPGKWVIAYQPLYQADSEGSADQYAIMNAAVTAIYKNVLAGGAYATYGGGAVIDTPGPTAGHSYQVMKLKLPANWSQFVGDIGSLQEHLDVRNLFYMGHCFPPKNRGTLGSSTDPDMSTDAVRLGSQLHNSRDWDMGAANGHPYRFVFICGCGSAKTDLPLAFGIPKVRMSSAAFTAKYKLPPRAFLGFKSHIPIGGIIGQPNDRMNAALKAFLTKFWATWTVPDPATGQKRTLQQAVDAAKKAADSIPEVLSLGYPISPQIYGCEDLLFDQN